MRASMHNDSRAEARRPSNPVVRGVGLGLPDRSANPLLQLQRAVGNQAVARILQSKAVARKPAGGGNEQKEKKAPAPKCDTGTGLRWGQDTTCSKWGFFQGVHESGEGKKWKSTSCCNSWPLSLEDYARQQGWNGAASCKVQHEREIATITSGDKEVEVLCSDTIPTDKPQVIEMSPKAMLDLSGQLLNPLAVTVCYSGSKQDLCLHNGPGAKSFPKITDCLTRGCPVPADSPTHKDSGWPRE